MKRSEFLQPLSREHHAALSLGKSCERAAQSGDADVVSQACQRAVQAFANELDRHFQVEERTLLPLLRGTETRTRSLVQRTLADHRQLHGLLDGLKLNDAEALNTFGQCLLAHVRFEERELFPAIERLL
ncbi:MAG: hemerythrin domain-containing protein [Thiobacillus sp.]|jgi:hemerythrin-like domain-containing protein|uniref:hemerythrin domain-containing protein n=1 Tax=Thiobacillus sp. TaxID=924 RepID=UPI002894BB4B|nr:hemerythrin domain-containing protein [Thiobacillus sp.]MDT3705489.1 hemerythrin domain-containing protein [Thiobacillus sp.]